MLLFLLFSLYICSSCASPLVEEPIKSGRIIGGEVAPTNRFNFVAAIHVTTTDSTFFCGGTLISDEWLITAGQCVYNAVLFTIQLGSISLVTDDPESLTLATSIYVVHPDFNPLTLENDLGLIRLRIPIEFTTWIRPIYTLPSHDAADYYGFLAVGWGQLSDDDPELANDLHWVDVTSLTNEECKSTYGNQITDNMVCVAGNYNEGICTGDTGGPLADILKTGIHSLYGVASFVSAHGCESTDPSGYTRVFPYLDWIRKETNIAPLKI